MYILDTDHLSFIQRNGQEGKRILAKLAVIEESEVVVTVITYEEQVRGRLNVLSRAKTRMNKSWGIKDYSSLQWTTNRL